MFTNARSGGFNPRLLVVSLGAVGALALAAAPARAGVPGVDVYLGAGVGQANVDLTAGDLGVSNFDKKDLGWKVYFGGRFVSMFGAELDYLNFGKPDGTNSEVKEKALAGFGMFYLPIPLPVLDVYAKAGVARLNSHLHVSSSSFSTNDTQFAYGAGVQLKFGSFAVRGEWEQYKVESSKPTMLSVGFSKSFL